MPLLQLIHAPNPIFSKKAAIIDKVDDTIRQLADDMFYTLQVEQGIGMGANMIGKLKRIIVIDWPEDHHKYTMINPEIIKKSEETQTFKEASLCFRGIEAEITRPKEITVNYLDYDGKEQSLEAKGYLATIIQHEVDYLNGITFLDHLSKMKRDRLLKKMLKFQKQNPPHIHGASCNH